MVYTEFAVGGKDYYLSDEWREWRFPESSGTQTVFTIDAKFRDPGDAEFRTALDRLIESLEVGIPYSVSVPPQGDCGEPFPAVGIN